MSQNTTQSGTIEKWDEDISDQKQKKGELGPKESVLELPIPG